MFKFTFIQCLAVASVSGMALCVLSAVNFCLQWYANEHAVGRVLFGGECPNPDNFAGATMLLLGTGLIGMAELLTGRYSPSNLPL
jgi:hypothetical protein